MNIFNKSVNNNKKDTYKINVHVIKGTLESSFEF